MYAKRRNFWDPHLLSDWGRRQSGQNNPQLGESPQKVCRQMCQSPERALQRLSNREVKKGKELFLQVRKFARSLMEHEENLLITRHNGIKSVSLLKVTGTKGAKGGVL